MEERYNKVRDVAFPMATSVGVGLTALIAGFAPILAKIPARIEAGEVERTIDTNKNTYCEGREVRTFLRNEEYGGDRVEENAHYWILASNEPNIRVKHDWLRYIQTGDLRGEVHYPRSRIEKILSNPNYHNPQLPKNRR